MTNQREKERGFKFFFWLSASLFILAGANWLFDKYIEIAGLGVPYLAGVVIMLVSIFLVAGLLMAAYHGVSNIRGILDGLLGLERGQTVEQTSTIEKEKPKNTRTTDGDTLNEIIRATPNQLSEAVSSVLSLYGSQVTSHASIAVGFVVAFFALVQVRGGLNSAVFFLALTTVIFGSVYSGLRLNYWVTLSTALLHGYLPTMQKFANSEAQKQEKRIPHAFVNEYAGAYLRNEPKIRPVEQLRIRSRLYKRKSVPLLLSVGLALLIASMLEGYFPNSLIAVLEFFP